MCFPIIFVIQRVRTRLNKYAGDGCELVNLYHEIIPHGIVAPQFQNLQDHGDFAINFTRQRGRNYFRDDGKIMRGIFSRSAQRTFARRWILGW